MYCRFSCLLTVVASYYLHSRSTASGARHRRSACIDMDVLRLAAVACCDMGWISAQRGVLCDWSCQKRLEACINAERGHSEHLLWHCLPDIPVATHHNRFFWEPPTTGSFHSLKRLKERNKPSVRRKSFTIHKLVWWHFQVEWASGVQSVLLWDKGRVIQKIKGGCFFETRCI